MTVQHVLIPLDFSPYAEQALDYAMTLAKQLQARVTLLHVIQPPAVVHVEGGLWPSSTFIQDLEAEVTRDMEAYLARVTAAGLPGRLSWCMASPFRRLSTLPRRDRSISLLWGHTVALVCSMSSWAASLKRWSAWRRAPCWWLANPLLLLGASYSYPPYARSARRRLPDMRHRSTDLVMAYAFHPYAFGRAVYMWPFPLLEHYRNIH